MSVTREQGFYVYNMCLRGQSEGRHDGLYDLTKSKTRIQVFFIRSLYSSDINIRMRYNR